MVWQKELRLLNFNTHSLAGVYPRLQFHKNSGQSISILTPSRECINCIKIHFRISISILTPSRECIIWCIREMAAFISILTPSRECIRFLLLPLHTAHFNTHSLAGVYRRRTYKRAEKGFQYSLPRGSVSRRGVKLLQLWISILTPSRECIDNTTTLSYSTYFNTHSLAGVYH